MALLPILPITDPRLRIRSASLEAIDDPIRALVSDMFETMYATQGAGLAAVQVGVPKRVIVMDVSAGDCPQPLALINPEIVEEADELVESEEGCLSMPGLYFPVRRPKWLKISYQDLNGDTRGMEAEGFRAVCVHHEIDHLNGMRSLERVSRIRRERLLARFRNQRRLAQAG